jgi:transposase
VLPGFTGVAVHDGLASYRHYPVEHGLCNAHHLRELQGLAETLTEQITWPRRLSELLVEIHTEVTAAKAAGKTRLPARTLAGYRHRYRALLAEGHQTHPPPPPTGKRGRPRLGVAAALLRRLDNFETDVLRFAHDFTVPFDNNQAERDIRMIRLQQKISGSWRTQHGADDFLRVRGYLSTTRKHRRNALEALRDLFTNTAWTPALTQ